MPNIFHYDGFPFRNDPRGIMALSERFSNNVCEKLDSDVYYSDDLSNARLVIAHETYELITGVTEYSDDRNIHYKGLPFTSSEGVDLDINVGNLFDLVNCFSNAICYRLENDSRFHDDLDAAGGIIADDAYMLVKYNILGLQNEIDM